MVRVTPQESLQRLSSATMQGMAARNKVNLYLYFVDIWSQLTFLLTT